MSEQELEQEEQEEELDLAEDQEEEEEEKEFNLDEADEEDLAKALGWNPDYDGPNKRSAKEFMGKRDNDLGVAKADIRKLEAHILDQNKAMDGLSKYLKAAQNEAEERGYKRAKSELESRMERAAEDGDVEALRAARQEERDLDKEFGKRGEEPAEEEHPIKKFTTDLVKDYRERYPRVFDNSKQADFWTREFLYVAKSGELTEDTIKKAADKATRLTAKEFGLAKVPTTEDGGGSRGAGKRTYASLPKEAKDAWKTITKANPDLTQEEFTSTWYSEYGDE